jgi:hypothetical protein
MSRLGMKIAESFGRTLPVFRTAGDARSQLFAERDERLTKIKTLAAKSECFAADETPESLKKMEAWYFQLVDGDDFPALGVSREEFEKCMATYFCQVAVMNCSGTEWHVGEYAFGKGKYEIGVKRGLLQLMLGSFRDHYAKRSNRAHTAIFREYQRYFTK